jgi:hypothetical protein
LLTDDSTSESSHNLLLRFNNLLELAHQTQEKIITRLLVYYKRTHIMNRQMKEVHKARYEEGCGTFIPSLGMLPS